MNIAFAKGSIQKQYLYKLILGRMKNPQNLWDNRFEGLVNYNIKKLMIFVKTFTGFSRMLLYILCTVGIFA